MASFKPIVCWFLKQTKIECVELFIIGFAEMITEEKNNADSYLVSSACFYFFLNVSNKS